jgi:2,4-dienoyl-CoA reductase-like NADH-dependent reductase (Old Yellow Enzyme family)
MNERYAPMFKTFTFRNGVQLKNRMIMSPMGADSSDSGGFISDVELKYYAARVKGAGMAGAESHEQIPGLRRLVATLKEMGAKAILQIFHAGASGIGKR